MQRADVMAKWDRVSVLLVLIGIGVLAFAAWKPSAAVHPVTASMMAAADAVSGGRVASVKAIGSDGRIYDLSAETADRPLVLVFIKDGCPCSEAAEPFFHQLHAAYGSRAGFLGVIDGDVAVARDWSIRHATPYPVLADPDRRIVTACAAERSAYLMLVARGGSIEKLWPGYGATMLTEVGAHLARMTELDETALDTVGAPTEMVSGCPF
jgi:peroxiredoxin